MNEAGNLEAIRDWAKWYFYSKSDINNFMVDFNDGFTAYGLTIYGPANAEVTMTEQNQQTPKTYTITLNGIGEYRGLFFFHTGATILLTGVGINASKTLSNYVDTIFINSLVGLIPIMTSNTTPSGAASASSIASGNYDAYKAFIQQDTGEYDRWVTVANTVNAYLQYQFPTAKVVKQVSFKSRPASRKNGDSPVACSFKFQGSNDGNTFIDLGTFDVTVATCDEEIAYPVYDNDSAYLYYRIQFIGSNILASYYQYCGLALCQMYGIDSGS